jgi:hypothetical protein
MRSSGDHHRGRMTRVDVVDVPVFKGDRGAAAGYPMVVM